MVLFLGLLLVARPFASFADTHQVHLAITYTDFLAGIGGAKRMTSLAVRLPLTLIRVLVEFQGEGHVKLFLHA
jgi:hypothetical protein